MNKTSSKSMAMLAFVATIWTPISVYAVDKPCPSADDSAYATQVGETWASLGGRAYCLDGPNARSRAALALYEYNRGRVGPSVNFLPDGTTVCLPKYLHGPFFDAERCRSAPVSLEAAPEPASINATSPEPAPARTPSTAICGNGKREADEVCDGGDLGGATCATFGLPPGALVCRASCQVVDVSGCLEKPKPLPPPVDKPFVEAPKRPDEPTKSKPMSFAGEFAAGALFPLSDKQRMNVHGALGLARAGTRFGVGPIELSLQGVIGGGIGTTLFNDVESHLETFIAGGGLQIGVPLPAGSLRVTPGVEVLRLWMSRSVDMPPGYQPAHYATDGGASYLGAFLRPEYRFTRFPRLAAAIEVAVDFVPTQLAGLGRLDNFQLKTLAGVSYAAF